MPNYLVKWISNFLKDRKFAIVFNGVTSTIFTIKAGVPQGCIISPVLFSIYISDISKCINGDHGLYADDISNWANGHNKKEIAIVLQQQIDNIHEYCQKWCLKLNDNKTTYTIFTPAGKRKEYESKYAIDLKLNNTPIQLEPHPKFLGITFDPKMSMNQHINTLNQKIQTRISMIRALKGKFYNSPIKLLVTFYKMYIRPLYEYANIPLLTASENTLSKLQKIQNKIIRIILNSNYLDSTIKIHNQVNLPLLKDRLIQLTSRLISIIANDNSLIEEKINEQININNQYKQKTHKKRRRTSCLDYYSPTKYIN